MESVADYRRFDYRSLAARGGAVMQSFDLGTGAGFGRLLGQVMRLSQTERLIRPHVQSPVVYSCLRVNADAFGGIPRRVWLDDEEEAGPDDPLVMLLDRPNKFMGGRKFQRATSTSLDMAGGVYYFLHGKDGRPVEAGEFPAAMWPVRDDLVEPEGWVKGVPTRWRVQWMQESIVYEEHQVCHVYYPDPSDMFRGLGPMQAAWRSADHLHRAEAFDDGLVEHGGQIGGVFVRDGGERLDKDELAAANKMIEQNVGRAQNDRKKLILPPGLKYVPTAFSQVEMQAIEMRKMKRDEIAKIFGVPPVMLGELEDANRSSLREQRRVYYENLIGPRAEFVEEELANQLIPKLPEEFQNHYIQLDYASTPAMREDVDAQIARMGKLVGMGVPVARAAEIAGLDLSDVEGGDERFLSTALRPMSMAVAMPEAPAEEEPEEQQSVVKHSRDRRAAAVDAEEHRLAKSDRRVKKAVRRVFDDYVLAQLKRVRAVAGTAGGRSQSVRPWSWYTESAAWSESAHRYARIMGMEPVVGGEGWVEVHAVSEDELAQLILGNERKWGEELWGALKGPLRGAIEDAAEAARQVVSGRLIGATDPAIIEFLRQKEIQLVEGPMSVVAEQVKRALIAGMADAPQAGTLADRVREALESLEEELRALQDRLGTRAAMIARTESASASNAARTEQYKAAGIAQHEWASAGDDLVREGHDIDGELAVVGEVFTNGLRHPGDPRGAPGNTINCRCTTLAVIQ